MQSFKADELPENPRERANPVSDLLLCFVLPMFFKGRKKTLDQKDLYRALKEHKSETLGNKLNKAWEAELESKRRKNKEPSLLLVVMRVFGLRFAALGGLLFLLEIGLRSTQPLFLGGLVNYYANSSNKDDKYKAYLYAMGVIVFNAVNVLFRHPYMLGIQHIGMKVRLAMCNLIYRKALRLNKTALGDTTTGQVVNLISNDVGRLDTSIMHVNVLWVGPIEITVVAVLLYREIGVASLFGIMAMLLFVPLQLYLGRMTSKLRLRTALRTDERVRMMNEIISGIQVIKMYAWEKPFGKMVQYARRKEMNVVRKKNYISGTIQMFSMFMTRVSVFVSLVTFVLLGNFLTAEKAFVVTAFYSILRNPMVVSFPNGIQQISETLVSLKRIKKYLLYDEIGGRPTNKENGYSQIKQVDDLNGNLKSTQSTQELTPKEASIEIHNLMAKWDATGPEYTLNNLDLKVQPQTLVAVIGPVGSGKSSLIQAIIGELPVESGSITVNGSYSYASQEPWLFTGTVRQNILFGLPMDKIRYHTVVKKCALERDFELLPFGDKTIVGERGASLSGGQKARISLARAVYRKADIYLLDDPLSAVDSHVGRHLFDQCVSGFLRRNIVILVTHQLQFLENADLIVIMDKGRISAVGTYDSMRSTGLDFANLLTAPDMSNEDDNESAAEMKSASSQTHIQRQNSTATLDGSVADSLLEEADSSLQVQESREVGKIGWGLYKKYFGASGGYLLFSITMFLCIAAQMLASAGDFYVSLWVNKNEQQLVSQEAGRDVASAAVNGTDTSDLRLNSDTDYVDIYIFFSIILATIIFSFARSLLFFTMAMRSSTELHNGMYRGITRAAMYFFHTNPSGRILNRFAKDLGQVDEILPWVMMDAIQNFLSLFGIVIVISIANPVSLVATAVLALVFYLMRVFYLNTSRDVKRLEAVTRSPIYSHLSASLNGLPTIRAFGAQKMLISEFDNYQDLHSSGYYMFLVTSRAFGYWLDCLCALYIAVITLSFFILSPDNGGTVGLAVTQAMGLTGMVQWGMRQSAELENCMTSVERMVEYKEIEPEGELESKSDKKPPKTWPEQGKIIFDQLSLRYFPDPKSDRVLKSLSVEIQPTEKVGIVGRTGAGKSSLINALFRLSYNEGSIIIDMRNIEQLGLHDLRSKISIIPQEPVLFSGTMRYNLDPFDEYADAKLWEVLEEVELKDVVADLPSGLQSRISEGGTNFSVGQRQLVCLARAILRENKILVLDEATANVDPQTDAFIQLTIRSKFKNCTVLTIAHRLHTIMDSDKVLVMDAGRAVEFGAPFELLTESKTKVFYDMVKQTGNSTFENLLMVARKAYEEKWEDAKKK
ncbi:probable multidrug resistance-associated protein lethal(2)03659 [Anastrepha obliqua]|uniref:probable multidrug resistance-associated protein lethal(2)03659 n=1 Tax=Anastrepha obliqua TaxID=95512 RepID=UPI00240A30F1|nr:probable multidrug resistance-associated protein lethal(2)03659 [Anastrepha obliqua]XP_054726614.1 probable multidrug resistance-associated protein lethal(2)03659 [Anastrepha obliqua]XP_054726615.1 probable multidrug resistance-associated protein lethal(2)03659 [Anastrepha obliqua]XP_054726616.1 probable multidrug resistance-associated protein lethal(2)03659 [Anastrepha obliqua]